MRTGLGRMARGALLTALAFCWLAAAPVAAGGPDFEVALWGFPPYGYSDEKGMEQGEAVDTMRRVLLAMGYTPRFTAMPFKRCLAVMREGLMPMMLPCAVDADRLTYMQYSAPIYHITTVLWKKGPDLSGCWQDDKDLDGRTVGVGLGYSYGKTWDEIVAARTVSLDVASGKSPEMTHFQMTMEGRIDYFISDLGVGQFIKEQHAPRFDDVYPCPKIIGEARPFGAPVSRKYFEDRGLYAAEFLDRFNAVLQGLRGQ